MPNVLVDATEPTAQAVMNLARAAVNDMLRSVAGSNLTDTKPFTIEYLNAAIDEVQEFLALNGVTTQQVDNFIITPIPPVASVDPTTQVYIGKNGYNNGVSLVSSPSLPQDLIMPLKCWERQNGTRQQFREMTSPEDGLPSRNQGSYFDLWEWRQNRIYLIGSVVTMDLRVKYEQGLLPLAAGTDFSKAVIPLPGAKRALAFATAEYYVGPRATAGGPGLAWITGKKKEALDSLVTRYVRKDQRIAYRPRGFRSHRDRIDNGLGGSYK